MDDLSTILPRDSICKQREIVYSAVYVLGGKTKYWRCILIVVWLVVESLKGVLNVKMGGLFGFLRF